MREAEAEESGTPAASSGAEGEPKSCKGVGEGRETGTITLVAEDPDDDDSTLVFIILAKPPKGILKRRAIRRHDASEQLDAQMVENIRGTPWRPVPGRELLKIPTNIEEHGTYGRRRHR